MSFRNVLRQETEAEHAALDASLSNVLVDPETYARFLRGSLAAVTPIEEALVAFGVIAEAHRAIRICEDLTSLGTPTEVACIDWRPSDLSEAFGSAYVVEGSAMGGLAMAKTMPPVLTAAGSYLRGEGPETIMHWRAFVARLDVWATEASAEQLGSATSAARRTFEAYRQAFVTHGAIR